MSSAVFSKLSINVSIELASIYECYYGVIFLQGPLPYLEAVFAVSMSRAEHPSAQCSRSPFLPLVAPLQLVFFRGCGHRW